MEKHLDIKEGQLFQSRTSKSYFWPFPFSMPMRDPYYTGPMSEPMLSPAGGMVMPRRNPYYAKPTNPFLNPYNAQYRHTMWPVTQAMPRAGAAGSCPHHGTFCPTPRSGGFGMPPLGPGMGRPPRPPRGFGGPPMGPPPMGPLGPLSGGYGMPPMGPPPMGPMGGSRPFF